MSRTRTYRMSTREAAKEATRERIVAAAQEAFMSQWYDEVTLRGIAADAGVALQTVLNHFPTKEQLCAAANERLARSIQAARWTGQVGDLVGALTTLVDDYERTGDSSLRMLAIEERVPVVQPWIALGRQGHEAWVEATLAPTLASLEGRSRARRLAQLVAVTDVYTWRILRRDKGLSRDETIAAMCELVTALQDLEMRG